MVWIGASCCKFSKIRFFSLKMKSMGIYTSGLFLSVIFHLIFNYMELISNKFKSYFFYALNKFSARIS